MTEAERVGYTENVLAHLNDIRKRCTYGALAYRLHVHPLSVSRYLGKKRPRASWVVNATTGKPTGYCKCEEHPDLYRSPDIIRDPDDLPDT